MIPIFVLFWLGHPEDEKPSAAMKFSVSSLV